MSVVKETSIIRPPFGETTVDVVGLHVPDPHFTDLHTDVIIPPSGTLHIAGNLDVDGSLTCNPMNVDNIYSKTPAGTIVVHDPVDLAGLSLGGNTATVLDTDTALAASSDGRIATQHAIKSYVDSHTGISLTFNTPLLNTAGTVSVINSAAGAITSVSTDDTMAANSDAIVPTQYAIKEYVDRLIGPVSTVGGTAHFHPNGDASETDVGYRLHKRGDLIDFVLGGHGGSFFVPFAGFSGRSGPVHATIPVPVDYVPITDGGTVYTEYCPFVYMYLTRNYVYDPDFGQCNARVSFRGAGYPPDINPRIIIEISMPNASVFPNSTFGAEISLFQLTYVHN